LSETAQTFGREVVAPTAPSGSPSVRYPREAIIAGLRAGLGAIELGAELGGLRLRFSAKLRPWKN